MKKINKKMKKMTLTFVLIVALTRGTLVTMNFQSETHNAIETVIRLGYITNINKINI